MRNNQVAWYELLLLTKAGYDSKRLQKLQEESNKTLSYEQLLEMEVNKLKRIRSRVQ